MALTTAQIQQAYVTFFNRPADNAGLTYWSSYKGSDADLYNTFAVSGEYLNLFAGQNSTATVNTIYTNLLGRAPEVAGLTYWVQQLDSGALKIGNIALAIGAGAQGSDATTVTNKVSAATQFTIALSDTTAEIAGYASPSASSLASVKTWLGGVTTDATLATQTSAANMTAITTTVATGAASTGSTFTLTTGTDALTGTSSNDIFVGTDTTLTTADAISGGSGTDVLNVTMAAAAAPLVTLSSVETVNLTSAVATLGGPVNATNWTGVEKVTVSGMGVTFSDSVAAGTTGNAVTNLQNNVTLGVSNAKTADNNAALYASFAAGKVAAGSTLTLELNGVAGTTATTGKADVVVDVSGAGTVDATRFTKLAVVSTGTNVVQLGDAVQGDAAEILLTDITVTGAGATRLSVDGTNVTVANLVTLNAAAATGALTADVSASTKAVTFTGGSAANTITFGNGNNTVTGGAANDVFTLGAGNNTVTGGAGDDTVKGTVASFTALDTITLGDGTRDAVVYTDATTLDSTGVVAANLAILNAYSGVEVVGSDGAVTAIDAGYFTQTVYQLGGALVAAVNVTNVSSDTLKFTSGLTITGAGDALTVAGSLPNQTLTLEIGGAAAVDVKGTTNTTTGNSALVIASGISTVNLVSSTSSTTAVTNTMSTAGDTTIDNVSAGSFVLTGANAFTIAAGTAGIKTGFTKAVDFNASAFTGKLTISGSNLADVIKGGTGNDVITGLKGGDVLTGGAGANVFTFTAAGADFASGTTAAGMVADQRTITDWAAGVGNTIDLGATQAAAVAHTATAVSGTAKISATGLATFHSADTTLALQIAAVASALATDAAGTSVVWQSGSDAYLFIVGDATAGINATDGLIKLTGVTAATGLTFTGTDIATIA